MDNTQSLPLDCLQSMQFRPCPCKPFLNPSGHCFEPDPSLGEGYYWYYEQPNLFTVALMDLCPKEDYLMEYQQPDFISINYYDQISAEELVPYKKLSPGCIRGHVSNQELFRARCRKGMPIRGIELILEPGYYHGYLESRYPGEFPDPRQAFLSIDGSTDFPELVLILNQIRKFQGTGIAADLYYESKVAEALSLIIDRTRQRRSFSRETSLNAQDLQKLEAVKAHMDLHYASEIRAEQLAAMACMSQTKLRTCFKQVCGCTITEYLQHRRIVQAEYLLLQTDRTVSQVAEAVGYHHAGRFSSLFQKCTGLFPEEYRKLMQ